MGVRPLFLAKLINSRKFVFALSLALMWQVPVRSEPAAVKEFLRPATELSFEVLSTGEVVPSIGFRFRNVSGKVICVYENMWPGAHDFDVSTVEFHGPTGAVTASETYLESMGEYLRFRNALRLIVMFPGADIDEGYRFAQREFVFKSAGKYKIQYRVPVFDCSNLSLERGPDPYAGGWYLGDLVAEAEAGFSFHRR